MLIAVAVSAAAVAAWLYLLVGHGGFWRTGCRLPAEGGRPGSPPRPGPPPWPSVVAVVPARDEAAILPATLPSLLGQRYPGEFSVVLVDDASADGTGEVAARLAHAVASAPAGGHVATHGGPGTVPHGRPADGGPADGVAGPAGGVASGSGRPVTEPGDVVAGAAGLGPGHGGAAAGARCGVARLRVIAGGPAPAGWAGKVWAMAQGVSAAGTCDYLLFTDADIEFLPGTLTDLVTAAVRDDRALVSQMALLRAESGWERWVVPAFVYFFAQLYPFRRVGRVRSRTAAAAGGCMLLRRDALTAAGGLAEIAGARIDDVALGRLIKRGPARGRCWLGFTTRVRSRRPYPGLAPLWDMVARSAYTQLRYSPALLAGTVAGLLWLYLLPPLAGLAGLAALAAGGAAAAGWAAAAGLTGWALMTLTYLPVLRLYRLSWLRAPALPLIALLYAGMTVDSARRHRAGRGGEWKGRVVPAPRDAA